MTGGLGRLDEIPVTGVVTLAYVTLALLGLRDPKVAQELIMDWGMIGLFVEQGQPWRLITHAFVHGGLLHLAFNTYALILFGPVLERSMGSLRFALLYVGAAVGGGIVGVLFTEDWRPLVGGSGALFGMMGAMVAMFLRTGRSWWESLGHPGLRSLGSMIAINLVLGWLIPFISNAAHVGGLVSGFVMVFWFLTRPREGRRGIDRVVQGGWAALFAALVVYALAPVLRVNHLSGRYDAAVAAGEDERRRALARAIVRWTTPADILVEIGDNGLKDRSREWRGQVEGDAGR